MVRRYRVPTEAMVIEYYEQGRSYGVKEVVAVQNRIKELHFYPEARIDGLVKRLEFPNKTIEFFQDREDDLTYRSVKYDVEERVRITAMYYQS